MKNEKIKKVFEFILEHSKDPKEYERVYYRPKKWKSIVGFVFSLLCLVMIIILYGFNVNAYSILLFLGDIFFIAFFALNLFTKNGVLLAKYVEKVEEEPKKKKKKE